MIKKILNTATFKQSSITFIGTTLNGILGWLFFAAVYRFLGPINFGIITISTVTLTLIADVADIGTNTGLVKFVSSSLTNDKDRAYQFLKLSLEIKLIAWFVSFLIIYSLAQILAELLFHKAELITPLRLVAIGCGGALLYSFATSSMQAFQKYFFWSVVNVVTNFTRLILILILGFSLTINIESTLLVYIIFPFFGFFISMLILPAKKIFTAKNEFKLSKELFSYNIPVAIFTLISAISARLDTYLTASLLNIKEVGLYGVATMITPFMAQLVSAIGLVSAPKFASFQNVTQMITYMKKLQLMVIGLSVLGILSIPIVSYLIPVIYGESAREAIIPFIFVFIAMLVFLLSIPVHHSVIFYFGRPDLFIGVSIGHLLIIGIIGYFLISNFGIIGASLTVLTGTIFNFLYPLIWLLIKLKK